MMNDDITIIANAIRGCFPQSEEYVSVSIRTECDANGAFYRRNLYYSIQDEVAPTIRKEIEGFLVRKSAELGIIKCTELQK